MAVQKYNVIQQLNNQTKKINISFNIYILNPVFNVGSS